MMWWCVGIIIFLAARTSILLLINIDSSVKCRDYEAHGPYVNRLKYVLITIKCDL